MPSQGVESAKTALIVDDEPEVRRFIVAALARHGYRTLHAGGAIEALSVAQQDIDVLVTDFALPGADGITLAEWFIERLPGVGVVFTSGFTELPRQRLEDLPARWAFLPKPFRTLPLIEAVRSVVTEAGDARAA